MVVGADENVLVVLSILRLYFLSDLCGKRGLQRTL